MKKEWFKLACQRVGYCLIIVILLASIAGLLSFFVPVVLPQDGKPPLLYANKVHDDLKEIFLEGINESQTSILLIIYSLTDSAIISKLKQKSQAGLDVVVICDANASPYVKSKLGPQVQVHPRHGVGLMHQKILVVDASKTWIGSANFTTDSLRTHGNLVAGIYSSILAAWIKEKADQMIRVQAPLKHQIFDLGGQRMELSFLPDDTQACNRLIQLINTAKKTVSVAMFTWTRHDLANAIIDAHKRGVHTQVVIDYNSGKGSSAKVVEKLKNAGIPVRLGQGNGLLHYKLLYIDGHILVNGSANWTLAAFTKNDDCFIILHDLNEEQRRKLESLWEIIVAESSAA